MTVTGCLNLIVALVLYLFGLDLTNAILLVLLLEVSRPNDRPR